MERRNMVKCPVCECDVEVEEAVYNTKMRRYYHQGCYQELLDKKDLCDYICDVYNMNRPNNKMFNQMKSYREIGVSFKDMELALRYYFEVKQGDREKTNYGIGIIPYVLHEARQFSSLEQMEREKIIKGFVEKRESLGKRETVVLQRKKKGGKKLLRIEEM